jgi:hypothetical protein
MENSRLFLFTEYLPVSQSENGLMAFQKLDVSTMFDCIAKFFLDLHYVVRQEPSNADY